MTSLRGAFVLHLHYEDAALDLIRRVDRIRNGFEVWATGQATTLDPIRRALGKLDRPVTVIDTPNAGRDIGAFCFILPVLADCGFDLIAKLHTKGGGSGYGREWRDHMLDRLATPDAAAAIHDAFVKDPLLGLVGPDRLLKPVSGHMFRNEESLSDLTAQLWPGRAVPSDWSFFAGSMMWMRAVILEPLVRESERLAFQPEGGVHDGRLEHAVERVLGLAPLMADRRLAVVGRQKGEASVQAEPLDAEPLIQTLARLRQSRLDDLARRPVTPREIALSLNMNPLLDYLDGGPHDPNRLTHEAWRRIRRGSTAPSLLDWPQGPPASPITDGRAAGDASLAVMLRGPAGLSEPRWRRRLDEASDKKAPTFAIRVVVAAGAEERGGLISASLQRLGHTAGSAQDFDAAADLNLVLGGHSKLRPLQGPSNIFIPLERAARAAYSEYDRYDVALIDPALADLWNGVVRPPVGRLPRAEGDDSDDVDRWTSAVLSEALARLAAEPEEGAAIRILARPGAGGWPRSSAYLRLLAPLTFQPSGVVPRFTAPDEPVTEGATVIVQRDAFADVTQAQFYVEALREAHGRLVFDIDDALHMIGPDHPDHADFAPRLEAMTIVAGEADEVWTATEALAVHYRQIARRVIIKPNRLDRRLWREALARPPMTPRDGGPLRLLYMGTTSHDADLAPVISALDRLEAESPGRFSLSLIGGQRHPPERPWLRPLVPPANAKSYPRFVRWLGRQTAEDGGSFEIGLAPLEDTPFNAGKSDLKVLDYGALGLAPMISSVPAFANHHDGRHVIMVAGDDWGAGLEASLLDRSSLGPVATRAREYVIEERMIDRDNKYSIADIV